MTAHRQPSAPEAIADLPASYRLSVVRALIRIEEMRRDLYAENEAGDPCAVFHAFDCTDRLLHLRELETLIIECRAQVAAAR